MIEGCPQCAGPCLDQRAGPMAEKHDAGCRAILNASGASVVLLFAAGSAQAVNLNEAKRR